MSILAAIALAFAIALGSPATAPETPVQAAPVQQVQEHDPILEADAMATLDDYAADKGFIEDGNEFVVTYVETDDSSDSLYGEFTLESIDFPGKFHHYTYSVLSHA